MQLKEILSIEENRTEDSRGVIHLFQEGTFYRAYEWSAWLCHRYVHQFKVTHKLFRNIESSVLFVGFPVTSLPKYVQEGTSVFDVDEKCKDLELADDVIPEGMTVDVMKTDYEAWKASVPVTESVAKNKEYIASTTTDGAEKPIVTATKAGIMQQILAFPLESKTPIQCMCFIAELKQQVVSIM